MITGQWFKWLVGGALLIAVGLWVHVAVGWGLLLSPWRGIDPRLLVGAFALTSASYVFRAARLYDYLHAELGGFFAATLRLTFLHNLANNLLPMRLGEFAFPLLMHRYFGQAVGASIASLVWLRVLDLHVVVLAGLVVLGVHLESVPMALLPFAWLATLPIGLMLRASLLAWLESRRSRLSVPFTTLLRQAPREGVLLARVYFWTLLTWGSKLLSFSLIVLHFADIGWLRAVFGVLGAELSSVLPIHGIAGSGSYEAAMVLALLPFGVDHAIALIAAVNLHLFLLGMTLILGLLALVLPRPDRSPAR